MQGSSFKRPGLKGYTIGGAQISPMHGNFIVNTGNGKAEDVLALIQHVKECVYEQFGVKIETKWKYRSEITERYINMSFLCAIINSVNRRKFEFRRVFKS